MCWQRLQCTDQSLSPWVLLLHSLLLGARICCHCPLTKIYNDVALLLLLGWVFREGVITDEIGLAEARGLKLVEVVEGLLESQPGSSSGSSSSRSGSSSGSSRQPNECVRP